MLGPRVQQGLSGLTGGLWFITPGPGVSLGLAGRPGFGSFFFFLGKLNLQCVLCDGRLKNPWVTVDQGRDSGSVPVFLVYGMGPEPRDLKFSI